MHLWFCRSNGIRRNLTLDEVFEEDTIPGEEFDHGRSKGDEFIPSVYVERFTLVDPIFVGEVGMEPWGPC